MFYLDAPSYFALTLQHFQCFLLVAEQGTMVKASEMLNISQPLMSQKIAQLEVALHIKLFSRCKRTLQLTEAGERFLIECRRIMSDLSSVVTELNGQYGSTPKQGITIGFSDGQEPSSTGKMLALFQRELRDISVSVQIESRMSLCEKLLSDELDFCIMVDTEGVTTNRNLGYRKLMVLPQCVLVDASSELAQTGDITWRHLDGKICFWPASLKNTKYTKDIQRFFREQNITVEMEYRNVDYFTLRRYLFDNEHFTLTLSRSVDDPTLKALPLGGLTYPMIIAWKRANAPRLEPYVDRLTCTLKVNLLK